MRTESIDAWHSDEDEKDNYFSGNELDNIDEQFDINKIDEKVGYNNIYNDIIRYGVKLGKNKQYKRVVYVDKIKKIIKILNLKQEIKRYQFCDISKIEKDYNCNEMNKLYLRCGETNKDTYFCEFESAMKREQFTGDILEYHSYSSSNKLLSMFVGSWNVGDSEFDEAYISEWISFKDKTSECDIYVIGLQEVKSKLKNKWINGLLDYINNNCNSNKFMILNKTFLMGIGIIFIINNKHINKISHLQYQTVATGKGNIIGNKGATAISFQFIETTFLFINCHLAARAERFEKRAQNFTRIVKELNLGIISNIDILHQFTNIIWFGDLNYRVEQKWHLVLKLLETKNWYECLRFDQLYHQMKFNAVFSGFKEGKISFCPTYRWNRYENIVSNKREQPPSYTDRILYKTLPNSYDLWQEKYDSVPNCFGSDHRPVYSIFKFKPRIPYFSYQFKRKYSKVAMSFAEIKVNFTSNIITDILDYKYPMEIQFYYLYSSPNKFTVKNGQFIRANNYWYWRSLELDKLKIKPFINDPSFLCCTHIYCTFIQKNNILGYSIISLFDIFPKTLLNTHKIKENYYKINKHIITMNEAMSELNNQTKGYFDENNIKEQTPPKHLYNNQTNSKSFNTQILQNGINIGTVDGYLCSDGKLIRKHMRYSTTMSSINKNKNNIINIPKEEPKQSYIAEDIEHDNINEEEEDVNDVIDEKQIEAVVDDNNQWACQYCTFLNINNNTKLCEVCGGHKEQFVYEAQLQQLKQMGFADEDAIKAQLMAQAGNIDRAAHNLLLNVN